MIRFQGYGRNMRDSEEMVQIFGAKTIDRNWGAQMHGFRPFNILY